MRILLPQSPWVGEITVEELTDRSRETLNENLGMEFLEIAETELRGRMPVDRRTVQPAGVLHGGASMAFAETLASWAGYLSIDRDRFHVVGQEINANHVRPGRAGTWVYGAASPLHLGRRAHVWEVRIADEAGKLVCVSRCTLAVIEQASGYSAPEARA
ncbi:hotdog fold thioesterase [Leucobacter weissii]|uniref:Hotdog fold thioesterase n=1 Tax=Leucobacter weissii TaxID=1983706 RepID=A0A939SAG3_9MICO|nr:hotdog fold thioesterase [Leucobacter weissii]MBO1900388.1 hotdog fold thioesterase [Leucobacter weissii]